MKIKMRKTCVLCSAPIDSGLRGGSRENLLDASVWSLDAGDCIDLLNRCCINCFKHIASIGADLARREKETLYSESRKRRQERTAIAAATYASEILKGQTKPRKRGRREVVTVYPKPDESRQDVMLHLIFQVSRMHRWLLRKNRDVTNMIGSGDGSSLFWKESAHYRHLRKQYGIKGAICFGDSPTHNNNINNKRRNAFWLWRQFKEEAQEIEAKLKENKCYSWHEDFYGWGGNGYIPVWKREYQSIHFRQIAPIEYRRSVFRAAKNNANGVRELFARMAEDQP